MNTCGTEHWDYDHSDGEDPSWRCPELASFFYVQTVYDEAGARTFVITAACEGCRKMTESCYSGQPVSEQEYDVHLIMGS